MGGVADILWEYGLCSYPFGSTKKWVYEGSPFTFVTDGLENVAQAKAVAGDKDVGVIGANLVQQCIRSGLLDEIHLDLVPVLLPRDGVRLFDQTAEPIELECTPGDRGRRGCASYIPRREVMARVLRA